MGSPTEISRGMERGILILFMAASTVIGLLLLLPPIRQLVQMASSGETGVSLLTTADIAHGGATDAGALIVSGTFDSAMVVATGLADGTRWLLALGVVFGALTAAVTAGAVVYFLFLLMWRRPFHRSLIVTTQIAGCALLIGSILSGGLGGLGRMMAASELNSTADDVFIVGFAFEPNVLLAGLAVLALSIVFSYGTKLQRDTRGLV